MVSALRVGMTFHQLRKRVRLEDINKVITREEQRPHQQLTDFGIPAAFTVILKLDISELLKQLHFCNVIKSGALTTERSLTNQPW